ncbi:AAA family ATPase [uncultured Amnibacterium sp.]|uniref:AAA family ATPase n=1 Tax=uncultured Amnibacterium sp. TaxID=1631851 RepID=UPI0035CB62DF
MLPAGGLPAGGDPMSVLAGAFTASWLMRQAYPPLRYVLPGVQPEGLTIFAGSPKVGKSWAVLDTAVELARGGHALGTLSVGAPRPVLYMALEDGARRLQSRLHVLGVTEGPANLYFLTSVPAEHIVQTCVAFAAMHEGKGAVIYLDTLGKTAPQARSGETDYAKDYRVASTLKQVCDDYPGTSLTAVHHTRKASAEDFLDAVSGTQGLAGAADSILVLRRGRTEEVGTLSVTSRDAMEGEYAVTFDGGRWTLPGDLRAAAEASVSVKAQDGLGERGGTVVAIVHEHPGIGPKAISERTGIPAREVSVYLGRAVEAGRIAKRTRGSYTPVGSVSSVGKEPDNPTLPTFPTAL